MKYLGILIIAMIAWAAYLGMQEQEQHKRECLQRGATILRTGRGSDDWICVNKDTGRVIIQ